MEVVLDVDDLHCGYGSGSDTDVLSGVTLAVHASEVLCLLGPNGVGKTTLFRAVLGALAPRSGAVRVAGRDVVAWQRRALARTVAHVPQTQAAPFGFTAAEVVLMGRTPHLGVARSPGRSDRRIAEQSLDRLGVAHLAGRAFGETSGGERRLVLVARALAQQPRLLLLDEPAAELDLANQARLLGVVRELAAEGLAVVMISHAPDHAFAVADTAALLDREDGLRVGPPDRVLTEAALGRAYGRPVRVLTGDGPDGRALRACVPLL